MRVEGRGKHWKVFSLAGPIACLLLLCGGSVSAQTAEAPIYEACEPERQEIQADDLPSTVEPGRCPVGERVIVDGGVGSELPDPGEAVHVEALTTAGARELEVSRMEDGTIVLDDVGDETEDEGPTGSISTLARSPNECRDNAYNDTGYRETTGLSYTYARATTPSELKADAAEGAVIKGGRNITSTRNRCRLGDRVPAELTYLGNSDNRADVSDGGSCSGNEGTSEVSFGDLPRTTLAVACSLFTLNPSGYDEVFESDVKVNGREITWTTRPGARSCRDRFDLESTMTHERGHTFGLAHVSEGAHGSLTMSPILRPCSEAERTLGRGDVLGLGRKYEEPAG